jgi:LEA14-like dessication related protein
MNLHRPRPLAAAFSAMLAAAWLLAGCASLPRNLETPRVELLGIQTMSADMFAQKFRVRVKVANPNDLELPVRGLDYRIFLMGDSFAEGLSSDRFVLPARGEAEFDMVVTTNFVSSLGRLVSRVGSNRLDNLDYEIAGQLLLDRGIVRKVPFSRTGKVDLSRALGPRPGEI